MREVSRAGKVKSTLSRPLSPTFTRRVRNAVAGKLGPRPLFFASLPLLLLPCTSRPVSLRGSRTSRASQPPSFIVTLISRGPCRESEVAS